MIKSQLTAAGVRNEAAKGAFWGVRRGGLPHVQAVGEGLQRSRNPRQIRDSQKSGAESGALDAELARLVALWPMLPVAVRRQIMRLAEGSKHPQ